MFKWFVGLSLGAKILLSVFGLIVFAALIPSEEPLPEPQETNTLGEQDVQPEPKPQPKPAPEPAPICESSYTNVCIPIGFGSADYDCAGGSGNGPNYIAGPVYVSHNVLNPDPYDLDRDGDGVGCEN
jgi:hypothetical protein